MTESGSFAVEGGSFGKWSRQARILFIREVEVRPALWTTQLHASRDPNLRELRLQIARSVSPVLGFNITCYDVALQWRQLKKQYKRYLKLCEQFEKDNSRTLRPSFSFAKQMKFLLKDNAFYERCFGSEKRSVLNEQPFSNPTQDEECRESRKLRSLSTSNNYKSAILCSSDPQEDNVTCHEKNIHGLNEAEASGHWQEAAPTTEACDVQPQFSNFDRKQRLERDITDDDADARWWPYEARVMLIHEYRKRPALWTAQQDRRRCTVYAQCALRHEIAQLMSAKFDFKITGEDVARQWKYLKCQHRRYLRSIKRFEDDGIKRPLFQYAKFMNFLLKDDDYMSGLGLEKQFVLNEQQQPQLEVESLAWSVDSDGGQDEPNGVDNEVASVLHLHTREGEATAVEKTADYRESSALDEHDHFGKQSLLKSNTVVDTVQLDSYFLDFH
ncbi:unnamed protein product [Toxocara canis]|uniref:MADF domain-containing protein n=1 Tax=Toxocara canis TaxID=6265 RepID=A0A183TVN5_TOXCA|nr:unnamed protein product [Toxocara canis]